MFDREPGQIVVRTTAILPGVCPTVKCWDEDARNLGARRLDMRTFPSEEYNICCWKQNGALRKG